MLRSISIFIDILTFIYPMTLIMTCIFGFTFFVRVPTHILTACRFSYPPKLSRLPKSNQHPVRSQVPSKMNIITSEILVLQYTRTFKRYRTVHSCKYRQSNVQPGLYARGMKPQPNTPYAFQSALPNNALVSLPFPPIQGDDVFKNE